MIDHKGLIVKRFFSIFFPSVFRKEIHEFSTGYRRIGEKVVENLRPGTDRAEVVPGLDGHRLRQSSGEWQGL